MKLEPIDSKVATHAGYDPERKVLRLAFRSGLHYEYANVTPAHFAAFQAAPSKGAWIQANLAREGAKNHPFQRVPPLAEEPKA